ncbi:MAG TPA: hypothetical protein VNS99_04295 [Gaiellales bacterium]|nr:hypothetical protein [Gaiellales bacterium]
MGEPGRAVRLDPKVVRGMQGLALEQRTLLGPRAPERGEAPHVRIVSSRLMEVK